MNLRFILPEVPGLGVWQIDTGSKNSILNINSCAKVIKRAFGRVSMIPLKLTFEPIQVNNPETGKKQTVYVLNLRTDVTLAQLADAAREQSKMFMIAAPSLEDAFDVEVEKDIVELWGEKREVDTSTGEITEQPPEPEHTPEATESISSPPEQETNGNVPPEPEQGGIDFKEIAETLKVIHWGDATAKSWIKAQLRVPAEGSLIDALNSLNPDKLEIFIDHINTMKEASGA